MPMPMSMPIPMPMPMPMLMPRAMKQYEYGGLGKSWRVKLKNLSQTSNPSLKFNLTY